MPRVSPGPRTLFSTCGQTFNKAKLEFGGIPALALWIGQGLVHQLWDAGFVYPPIDPAAESLLDPEVAAEPSVGHEYWEFFNFHGHP